MWERIQEHLYTPTIRVSWYFETQTTWSWHLEKSIIEPFFPLRGLKVETILLSKWALSRTPILPNTKWIASSKHTQNVHISATTTRNSFYIYVYIYIYNIYIYTLHIRYQWIYLNVIYRMSMYVHQNNVYTYTYIYIHIEPSNTYPNLQPKASKIETKKKHDFWDLHRLHFHSATLDFHSHAFLVPKELPTW